MSQSSGAPASIHLLNSEVVDQIAAGEVVERPAHLVKELVENALDAGATSIEVEHDQGGRRVRVTDDGAGITRADLALALARHGTSKIARADDLWNLGTFGFRGEALASIGAVSRLTLTSRPRAEKNAHKIFAEFGRLGAVEPIGANAGTTVLIEELFANVPARLKFMKTEAGEAAQIKATMRALALANDAVEFRVRTKGKVEATWPKAENFLERAKAVLGLEKLYLGRHEYGGFTADVVFASPHDVAGNARSISIFVQGRWVQDRGLQAAVIDAYRGLLMHGEYPIAVVRLQAPPAEVDVNIHPTKSQIKFRDAQAPFRAVNRALREAIEKAPWLDRGAGDAVAASMLAGADLRGESAASVAQKMARARERTSMDRTPDRAADDASGRVALRTTGALESRKLTLGELTRQYESSLPSIENEDGTALDALALPTLQSAPVNSLGRFDAPEFDTVIFKQKRDLPASSANSVPAGAETMAHSNLGRKQGAWSRLQVIGQADLTYILAQDENGLVLVDQHAAHERVAYERLMRTWKNGGADVQALLLPLAIELEPDGAEALLSIASELETLGVSLDQVGPQAVAVTAKPALIADKALTTTLTSLAREIVERGGSFVLEKKIGDICATMACHSVVRAGQSLSADQMRSLLEQMDEFPLSSFCPHGRPVSVDYPFAKLERDFGRIV